MIVEDEDLQKNNKEEINSLAPDALISGDE